VSRRRIARRPSPSKLLDPKTFVQRLVAELGSDSAKGLVSQAFAIVEDSGKPNRWIFEVKRARERAAISPALAHFLIYKLAESAMEQLTVTHPLLSELSAHIELIEREHGLDEDEHWFAQEGPPEWQALNRDWETVFDELMIDIFLLNGERELAEAYAAEDEELFMAGRALIFGDESG
jgi:hypothetical protein